MRCAGRTITRTLTAPRPGESGRSGGRAATDRGRSGMACPWAPRVRSPGAPRLLVLRHKEPGRLAAASPSDGPRRSGPSDLVSVPAVSRTATGQLRRRRPVARSPKRSARLSRRDRRLPDDFDTATPRGRRPVARIAVLRGRLPDSPTTFAWVSPAFVAAELVSQLRPPEGFPSRGPGKETLPIRLRARWRRTVLRPETQC